MFVVKQDTSNTKLKILLTAHLKLGSGNSSSAFVFMFLILFIIVFFNVVFLFEATISCHSLIVLWDFNKTGLKYLKYSMGPGRGGIHISGVLCPVAIARIQSLKNVLCRFRLGRKIKDGMSSSKRPDLEPPQQEQYLTVLLIKEKALFVGRFGGFLSYLRKHPTVL